MKVLAAIDKGDLCYEEVLAAGSRLAGGHFDVIHVYPAPSPGHEEVRLVSHADSTAEARESIQTALEEDLRSRGLTATVSVPVARRFNTGDDLVEHAEDKDVDIIVIGTLGRTGIPRLLMGSVAERVVRLAHCDVYIVRPAEKAATES